MSDTLMNHSDLLIQLVAMSPAIGAWVALWLWGR